MSSRLKALNPIRHGTAFYCPECGAGIEEGGDCYACGWCNPETDGHDDLEDQGLMPWECVR